MTSSIGYIETTTAQQHSACCKWRKHIPKSQAKSGKKERLLFKPLFESIDRGFKLATKSRNTLWKKKKQKAKYSI